MNLQSIASIEDYMLPCPNKKLFGIEYFGCGMQRALTLLFHGYFIEAFRMFPAIYSLLLFVLFATLNFIDKKRNYGKAIIISAIVNALIVIISYFCKRL